MNYVKHIENTFSIIRQLFLQQFRKFSFFRLFALITAHIVFEFTANPENLSQNSARSELDRDNSVTPALLLWIRKIGKFRK